MNIDKIFEYKEKIENDLNFEEISKMYREILFDSYAEETEYQIIHCYQILRGLIDIYTQMKVQRRIFDEDYLKDAVKW